MQNLGEQRLSRGFLRNLAILGIAACLAVAGWTVVREPDGGETASRVLVQAADMTIAAELVRGVGGEVTHRLGIIDAVAAELTDRQLEALRSAPDVRRIYRDHTLEVAAPPRGGHGGGGEPEYSHYPALVDADLLHDERTKGKGVTIAVVDTGHTSKEGLNLNTRHKARVVAHYDAIQGQTLPLTANSDAGGHGGHVASIAVNSAKDPNGKYLGIAPDADLAIAKAFDANGQGTYADVIRALDWVVASKDAYGIRVVNLSFSGTLLSFYWEDPLNQAVMAAWQEGIVVVTSAGNVGPEPMTIGVPGNVPYAITVGAMTDAYTPADGSDDYLASFSSVGPTYESSSSPRWWPPAVT